MSAQASRKEFVVLSVEAGETSLSTRKLLIESAGFNAISAITARQAVRFSETYPVHAVIFDADVADMPLREFISMVRRRYATIPIYVVANAHWVPAPPELRAEISGTFEKMADPSIIVDEIIRVLPVTDGAAS